MTFCVCIKVMDARGGKSLALFPAKFQKSMWIKRGLFQRHPFGCFGELVIGLNSSDLTSIN